ncbi:MAG: hypothetical protein E7566_04695 [Ruminococcaceae bacterium]|nr:hypothetical protein [Oscillospiraceae bacterium]
MKIKFISMLLCVFMFFSAVSLTVGAQENTELCEFEYLKRDVSTGDGYVLIEYAEEKITLSGDRDTTQIPKGENIKVTIKAVPGSVITEVVYDGVPMGFGDPAQELNMTIENFGSDHSLKITYEIQTYTCSVKSIGNGSVSIIEPQTDRTSVSLPVGENFIFYAEAQEGFEITAITVNGEAIDLTKYGQTDVIKITRFQMELPQITETTDVLVVFSSASSKGKFGDVNSDDKVNVVDATLIQKFVAGLVDFDANQSLYGDVDGDLRITVKDATAVQKYTAGIISSFPAENR